MARTGEILTGLGQAGSQVGEALLKVSMMRDQRQQRATSNALNMAQLDQAERRIDQDAEQMAAAALRHDETTAFNAAQANAITGDKLRAMMERGYELPEGISFSEGVQKIRNGENPGDWGDWVKSIEGQEHQQRLDMESKASKELSQWYSGEGHGPGGAPFPAGSLSERARIELDREYIKADGRTFRSANHPDVISGALEHEEEEAKQWMSEVGIANLSPLEQEMARQMTIRFLQRGGEEKDLFNLTPDSVTPTDSVTPPDSAEFRSNDDSLSGRATEQREGAGDPVLFPTVDSTEIARDTSVVDTLVPAFQDADTATASPEGSLRMQAEHLMRTMPDNPQIRGMTLEQVIEWLGSAAKGSTP